MSQLVLKQGKIHDVISGTTEIADIFIKDGKIQKIAEILEPAEINEAEILDATGLEVYPGFVDAHCHLGMEGYATGFESEDANEVNDSVTPQLHAADAVNPMDVTFEQARNAGVTAVAVGPGSSNVVGGTFCVMKTAGKCVDKMLIKRDAAMKCAFGENPKNCYRDKDIYSRMTIASKLRELLKQAQSYEKRKSMAGEDILNAPEYDAKLEAMLPVLHGEIPLKAHVHRADDIFTAIRIAEEFGIGLTLDHVTEGHLIKEELAMAGYSLAIGPSFGHADKPELIHKTFCTPGILAKAGCKVAIITDSPVIEEQYLPVCAWMAVKNGMDEADALRAITIRAAEHVGVADWIGSIGVGKDADFVLTDKSIFDAEYEVIYTIIDGKIVGGKGL